MSNAPVVGPTLAISEWISATKYRSEGESFREMCNRIASALKDSDEHFHAFRDILLDMRFSPAGRVCAAIGAARKTTPYNCYVSGTIEDSTESIYQRLTEAAQTMRKGGGIGYDFSNLRPKRDPIKTLESSASGPISFMSVYDASCGTICSAGHRRGAQMAVLRVDHPDIEEYVHAKQNEDKLRFFNTSVAVTDEFMVAVLKGTDFDLKFNGTVRRSIDARALWEQIMRSTWDWAEPGVLFIDTINRMNNLYYCETIAATNPCGEQPLPPHGACLLGSFNLARYIRTRLTDENMFFFDWDLFIADIAHVVRAQDNIVDVAIYPLSEQEGEAKNKRRMGLGVMATANALEALGFPYGSAAFVEFEKKVLRVLNNVAYSTSAMLAKEKGAFPLFDSEKYLRSKFIAKLDPMTRDLIERYGIRNSHLTSIAPTGTISLCADNVSSGIEPVYSYAYDRQIIMPDGPLTERVTDYGLRVFGVKGKRSSECTIDDHLNVLLAAAEWVDSAVSKTCNIDPAMPWDAFKNVYMRAWQGGAKGCTTFNPGGKRSGILTATDNEEKPEPTACYVDAAGNRSCE